MVELVLYKLANELLRSTIGTFPLCGPLVVVDTKDGAGEVNAMGAKGAPIGGHRCGGMNDTGRGF